MPEEVLHGGVANAGAVFRSGPHVLRPSNPHSASIHRALEALRAAGFEGASRPVGIEPDGRERLEFIVGDVPLPPYPEWAQSDDVLASITELIKSLHDASQTIDLSADQWSNEMADPSGGPVFCHNDVCLENVVFRDNEAVGLIDFDFAAPGRRVFDLASFARMCVPIDDQINSAKNGWVPSDPPRRLRLVADSYGLNAAGRNDLIDLLAVSIAKGGEFVLRHVEAGEPGFVTMWNEMGGMERFDRRRGWWATARTAFEDAMS
jgi:hypothetical protein